MWFGMVLVVIGVLFLLKTLGVYIPGNLWGIFWALVLIAIGASIITRGTKWGLGRNFPFGYYQARQQKERIESLKRRYARGEITKEEFEKMKEDPAGQ